MCSCLTKTDKDCHPPAVQRPHGRSAFQARPHARPRNNWITLSRVAGGRFHPLNFVKARFCYLEQTRGQEKTFLSLLFIISRTGAEKPKKMSSGIQIDMVNDTCKHSRITDTHKTRASPPPWQAEGATFHLHTYPARSHASKYYQVVSTPHWSKGMHSKKTEIDIYENSSQTSWNLHQVVKIFHKPKLKTLSKTMWTLSFTRIENVWLGNNHKHRKSDFSDWTGDRLPSSGPRECALRPLSSEVPTTCHSNPHLAPELPQSAL